ncbi:hypothetical protein EC957_007868 [Mortierella hygrophila]|uniref:alpha-1,2-Mannosidase n=1 Tax=Mortierella hygrophila TaxID=979708 RepID=A0A9P6EY04_9FUNG|nr:hypothetical protein EC957_007868 [Mortierella hygrophila]
MEPPTFNRRLGQSKTVIDIEKGYSEPDQQYSSSARMTVGAPLGGLKKLFDYTTDPIVSGRYTINLRRLFVLLLILIGMITTWFVAIYPEHSAEGTDSLIQNAVGITNQDHLMNNEDHARPHVSPHTGAQDSATYRYERVRGKGARTSLKKIQFKFPPESSQDRLRRESRLQAVRDGFEHAWTGYRDHAWGHDEVSPVSGGYKDNFNGWGATMIDSLDTLVIMGFNKEFDEALEWVKTTFTMTNNTTVQLPFFETIIRYMGGFLGAYDLTGEKVLLDKAEELGKHTLNAFQGSDFPNSKFTIDPSFSGRDESFVLAEIGTFQLEFSRLSKLTGNPIYDQKARKIFDTLGTAMPEIPGLLPPNVQDGEGRKYSNFQASVGGMVDSYYEYLLKEWILLDGKATKYKEMFEEAVSSIKKYMVMTPEDGSRDYVILGQVNSAAKTVEPDMGHLACFMSGSLAMGSKYFGRSEDLLLARQVAQGCYLGYHHSASGLAPEAARFTESSQPGKFVTDPQYFFNQYRSRMEYILRPETLESLWILYRLTGEKKYQDQAWEIFQSLERSCRTSIAYTGLTNVNNIHSKDNKMESFFLAETLKYLYLIFSTPDVISLDDFVLNTEAHPLLRT